MTRSALVPSCLAAVILGGCAGPAPSADETISGRDDLKLRVYETRIENGLSEELVFEAPEGLESVLIEVRGDRGLYYLTKFQTPNGDVIEGAQFTTRFAREVPGLVDWLYPNTPSLSLRAGTYKILLRGEAPGGGAIDEDVEVRLYTKAKTEVETCGIHLDFLVDMNAIEAADFERALDRSVVWINDLYAPLGVRVIDYSLTQIRLPNPNFNVADNKTVTSQIDDVLRQARSKGIARTDSVHVVVVRTIGGTDPAGYAMGLPGPFDADRSNAAVLVATDAYKDGTGTLDVEGMASTVAHEIGHYMGLYHTSESNGTQHDPLPDTPECNGAQCPPSFATNIMSSGGGARRTVITANQAFVVRQHPLCKPQVFAARPPDVCDLACTAPETCSIVNGAKACRAACDPDVTAMCTVGQCSPDMFGTYVCQ